MSKRWVLLILVFGSALVPLSNAALQSKSAVFDNTEIYEGRGDIASIEIDLRDTETATLHIEFQNYDAEIEVTDGNGDGTVIVGMNTYLAGRIGDESGAYRAQDSDDSISVTRRSPLRDELLLSGQYTMRLVVDGQEEALAKLLIEEPTVDSAGTWSLPSSFEMKTANSMAFYHSLNEREELATDSIAAFDVGVSGVYGLLQTKSGTDATARFLEGMSDGQVGFEVVQSNAKGVAPKRLDVRATATNGDFVVVPDGGNDTLLFAIDPSEAVFTRNGERVTAESGDTFTAEFSVSEKSGLYDERASVATSFGILERKVNVDHEGDRVTVEQAHSQTITGATTLAPGTELLVKLRSTDAPFLKEETVTVQDDGRFSATYDLSTVTPSDFTVVVAKDGTVLKEVDGQVVESIETTTTVETTTDITTVVPADNRTDDRSYPDDSTTTTEPSERETTVRAYTDSTSTDHVETETLPTTSSDATTETGSNGGLGVGQLMTEFWNGVTAVWGYIETIAVIATLVGTTLTAIRFRHWRRER